MFVRPKTYKEERELFAVLSQILEYLSNKKKTNPNFNKLSWHLIKQKFGILWSYETFFMKIVRI